MRGERGIRYQRWVRRDRRELFLLCHHQMPDVALTPHPHCPSVSPLISSVFTGGSSGVSVCGRDWWSAQCWLVLSPA